METNLNIHKRRYSSGVTLLSAVGLLVGLCPSDTIRAETNSIPLNQEKETVEITSLEPIGGGGGGSVGGIAGSHEVAWLGIATDEAPEVLTAQMKLDPGVGLVVTLVVENSPAEKAGIERNDLLVGFNDQALVHPAQLRKLVQSRKEGDLVRLTYYREGKKQTAEATLGKTEIGPFGDPEAWQEQWRGLQNQFKDMHLRDEIQKQLERLRGSVGDIRIDQQQVRESIRQAMDQARQAMDASRNMLPRAGSGPEPPDMPRVTVRRSGGQTQSLVQADDTGTYVLVRNPRLRLTAHDRDGKLIFDGEIETKEQRSEVPPDLWQKVKPLADKLSTSENELPPLPGPLKELPRGGPNTPPVNPPPPPPRGTI